MKFPFKLVFSAALLASFATASSVTPASAITVELAKQCRDMSIKAFPPARVGTKSGNAGEARNYYRDCVANNGKPPADKPKPAAAPAPAR